MLTLKDLQIILNMFYEFEKCYSLEDYEMELRDKILQIITQFELNKINYD